MSYNNDNIKRIDTLTRLFQISMKRNYFEVIEDLDSGVISNLNIIKREYPEWDVETMQLPYIDNSVNQIIAYDYFQYIKNVPFLISECYRVLTSGGHINIIVPYYHTQTSEHKSAYSETTFKFLTKNLPMRIVTNFIIGDSEETLNLIVQLRKEYNS